MRSVPGLIITIIKLALLLHVYKLHYGCIEKERCQKLKDERNHETKMRNEAIDSVVLANSLI